MSRRSFVKSIVGGAGLAGTTGVGNPLGAATVPVDSNDQIPPYARAQKYRSPKQSSHDVTGGNADAWEIKPGAEHEVFSATGAGVISHIWFTIAADMSS